MEQLGLIKHMKRISLIKVLSVQIMDFAIGVQELAIALKDSLVQLAREVS